MIDVHHGWNKSYKPQCIGFVLSLILTFAAHRVVENHHLSNMLLIGSVIGFAVTQALLQLIFFLHLGLESKPHWNTITFLFVVLVIVIVIGGSLWIMNNLDYNLMPPMEH
ncbi:MAG: cytochrome o ubiquinol oxidase subunit IV [Candidatus Melainabacteria bacterium]|nr:cytochrome o ubiquinol oxidase subunit IV [Candidatus Melainabacteria bacterium]